MKSLLYYCVVCLLVIVIATSCKDDEKKGSASQFTINGSSTAIRGAAFLYDNDPGHDQDGQDYYRNELIFHTDGITIEALSMGGVDVDGSGSIVDLLVNNATQTLEAGTYTFQGEENEQPFDFWSGAVYLNWNKADEASYDFTDGEVHVSKSGSSYTIEFEGTIYPSLMDDFGNHQGPDLSADPLEISGYFKGSLPAYESEF